MALNCLVFEKIAFFAFWRQTDEQTDEQMDSTERRLIKNAFLFLIVFVAYCILVV